ncbi:MAG TPA: hypothetical protein VFA47_00910 [Candidatus Manganitrophaceae bacterium]|nr:hypothetical protein [Candidatus Manganitrophaceae bacterium]
MEALIGDHSVAVYLIRVLCMSVGFFVFATGIYLFTSGRPLHKKVRLACPVTGDPAPILFRIDILKDPQRIEEGIDVVRCPQFCFGEIICSKGCVFNGSVQEIHQVERRRHLNPNGLLDG